MFLSFLFLIAGVTARINEYVPTVDMDAYQVMHI